MMHIELIVVWFDISLYPLFLTNRTSLDFTSNFFGNYTVPRAAST